MKYLDVLFGFIDVIAVFFSLLSILDGEANIGNYIWLVVAILWGLELVLKAKEGKTTE